ncbi:MAG: hypothetical protein HUK22_08385, partial [Thermoguttaceae bacterium]|nr:hypothetical protein [Thermoguttaceae bacterium]
MSTTRIEKEKFIQTLPTVVVKPPKGAKAESPVRLTRCGVSAKIDGAFCRVSIEADFFNSTSQILEGELVFPTPEGVAIAGYALDVDGELREAVAVTKEKARVVFEKEERRRVDPGIVEKTDGNQFRTRVYPLPARGKRTIRVEYVATAEYDAARGAQTFRIPAAHSEKIDEFDFSVVINRGKFTETPVDLEDAFDGWAEFQFDEGNAVWRARTSRRNFRPHRPVVVALPTAALPEAQFERTENGVFLSGALDVASLATPAQSAPSTSSESLAVFWDCSGSRAEAGKSGSKETAFLRRILRELVETNKTRRVRLIPFRNEIAVDEIQIFEATDVDSRAALADAVLDAVEAAPYDGATSLAPILSALEAEETAL